MTYTDETTKYKKKRPSDTSHARRKSKHKHDYADCLLRTPEGALRKAQACRICGKIYDIKYMLTKKISDRLLQVMTADEIKELYSELPEIPVGEEYIAGGYIDAKLL